MTDYLYPGSELELFASATNWKQYLRSRLAGFLGRDVLEVGAGLGATTLALCDNTHRRWVCLEPDRTLAQELAARIKSGSLPSACQAMPGTVRDCEDRSPFDSVIYIDVLEHIEADRAELQFAAKLLKPGGHLVVLSPAHAWLFTPFDQAIGHYRRYSLSDLKALIPPDCIGVRYEYLDSVGILASLANRLLLRQSVPTSRQIQFWDRVIVPCSRYVDRLVGHQLGKSVLAIWQHVGT